MNFYSKIESEKYKMGFNEDLIQLSKKFIDMSTSVLTEEATKMSMVVPFFQFLGYDVFNPNEFCPEYTTDVGIKKGEKVDYAIMQNGIPIVLIECKWCGITLDKHGTQLFRYFGTSAAKFGILTNGLIYRFYTDLNEANKMDLTPFLEINMSDLKESSINELKKFSKSLFDKENILSTASELKYSNSIKDTLKNELESPSDDFVRFFLTNTYEGQKNQKTIDKFKPIVKKTFSGFINEIINQKIAAALNTENVVTEEVFIEDSLDSSLSKIITTSLEMEAFYITRSILSEYVPVTDVLYKDTESYFGILFQNNNRKPICRFNLDTKKMQILIPDENKIYIRYYIDSLTDIYKYKNQLIEVIKRYIVEPSINTLS